jgi:hypothetical protein
MEQAPVFIDRECYEMLSPEVRQSLGLALLCETKDDGSWVYHTNSGEKKVKKSPSLPTNQR